MASQRTFLFLLVTCFAAAPLMAYSNPADESEARAALGTIKDRLRVLFIRNGNRLEPHWTIGDLVNVDELDGQYYDRASYGVIVRSVSPPAVTIYALHLFETDGPQVVLDVTDVATGSGRIESPGSLPIEVLDRAAALKDDADAQSRAEVRGRYIEDAKRARWLSDVAESAKFAAPLLFFCVMLVTALTLRRPIPALSTLTVLVPFA